MRKRTANSILNQCMVCRRRIGKKGIEYLLCGICLRGARNHVERFKHVDKGGPFLRLIGWTAHQVRKFDASAMERA